MKKYIYKSTILILILLTSCQNHDDASFSSLSNAFDNWYLFHNPYSSSTLDPYNIYIKNKIGDRNYMKEYLLDLKRFKLELNQIKTNRLNKENLYKYNSIYKVIENNLYEHEILKDYSKNPLFYIATIRNNFLNILLDEKINNYQKIEYIDSFLDNSPKLLERSRKVLSSTNSYYTDKASFYINEIKELMDISMDFIDTDYDINISTEKIINVKKILKKYKYFIEHKLPEESFQLDENNIILYNEYITRIEEKYNAKNSIKSLELSITNLQNNIFKLSLPIYLLTNDEPIWVDREDTLKVIHHVINNNFNKEISKDIESKIIEFRTKYNLIETFVESKNIFKMSNLNYTFPQENISFKLDNKKIKLESSFNSYSTNILFPGNEKFIHGSSYNLFIINTLLPKMLYYKDIDTKIIFENDNLKYAWGILMSNIFIENNFTEYDKNFELLHNIELLRDFVDILLKEYIINKNKNESDIIELLQDMAFYTLEESKNQSRILRFSNRNNLENYLTYLYLNNLYDINCIISNKISEKNFIKLVFKYGFIPVHNYNYILN